MSEIHSYSPVPEGLKLHDEQRAAWYLHRYGIDPQSLQATERVDTYMPDGTAEEELVVTCTDAVNEVMHEARALGMINVVDWRSGGRLVVAPEPEVVVSTDLGAGIVEVLRARLV